MKERLLKVIANIKQAIKRKAEETRNRVKLIPKMWFFWLFLAKNKKLLEDTAKYLNSNEEFSLLMDKYQDMVRIYAFIYVVMFDVDLQKDTKDDLVELKKLLKS
jgi:hypothetical protein